MKQGWEIKKIEEICITFTDGDWIESKDQSTSGIRLIQTGNIGNGYFKDREEKARYVSETTFNQLKCTEIFENDCLISRLPEPVGRACIIPKLNARMITAVDCSIIRLKNNTVISKWFLYYSMSNNYQQQINSQISGATRQRISRKNLGKICLPIPPLPEQERVVSILDKTFSAIDQAIQNAEKNLKNAKELFDSYLNGIFTNKGEDWEEKTLKEISIDFGRGKSKHRPRNDKILYDGIYPFIQTGDIRNCNHYITNYTQTYNEIGLAQSKIWKKGTICITIAANIAETGILTFDGCFPDSIIGLYVNEEIANNLFVEYLLQFFKTQIQSLSKGSAQANINMQTFENKKFPFPPLLEQQNIVIKLDMLSTEINQLEEIYQQKIIELEDLKKSILQKAFNGEI